jgi:hypothetical protein
MWGFGKLGFTHPGFLDAVVTCVMSPGGLERYTANQLTLLTWGFAMLDCDPGTSSALCLSNTTLSIFWKQ